MWHYVRIGSLSTTRYPKQSAGSFDISCFIGPDFQFDPVLQLKGQLGHKLVEYPTPTLLEERSSMSRRLHLVGSQRCRLMQYEILSECSNTAFKRRPKWVSEEKRTDNDSGNHERCGRTSSQRWRWQSELFARQTHTIGDFFTSAGKGKFSNSPNFLYGTLSSYISGCNNLF